MSEVSALTTWTFVNEVEIPQDVQGILVEGEQAVAAYKTFRDSAVFTNKRLILRDAQGLTGKQVDVRRLDRLIAWAVLR